VALLSAAGVRAVLDLGGVRLDVLADLRIAQVLQPRLVVRLWPDPLTVVGNVIGRDLAGGRLTIAVLGPGVGAGRRSRRRMIGTGATRTPTAGRPVTLDGVLAMGLLVARPTPRRMMVAGGLPGVLLVTRGMPLASGSALQIHTRSP